MQDHEPEKQEGGGGEKPTRSRGGEVRVVQDHGPEEEDGGGGGK